MIVEEQDEFVLRPYQSEILENAVKKNTIVYLPTGAGKTYIAVMLISRLSDALFTASKKVSVMLVNTVPLVEQHCETIRRHTDFGVGQFTGDMNVDYWTKDQWLTQLKKYNVYVMTAQIFLDILRASYLSLERVNLIIFDECHQAVNDQPMRQIMQLFEHVEDVHRPRVLGLTATLLNGNCPAFKVKEQVRSLEKTFHGTVATVKKLKQVVGFSTNPTEKITRFAPPNQNDIIELSINMITNLMTFISEFRLKSDDDKDPRRESLNEEKGIKPLTRSLSTLILHIEMFGIYGASRAVLSAIIQLERFRRQAEDSTVDKILCLMITTLTSVLKLFEDAMKEYNTCSQIMLFSTPQVLTLFEIIRHFKESPEKLCGIVFVKQRFTAKILYYIVKSLSECDPDFSFIKTDFMVGFNAGSQERDTRETFFSAKINKKIVNSFRNHELNLLIASNVVEEGIDIPRCTLVVKFDRPMDYRSYIQSKGRARHGDSLYYILVPEQEREKYGKSYYNFQEIEKQLQEFLVGQTDDREAPSNDEIRSELYEDHDVPPYYVDGPDSSHVAAVSAISLLNRYCQSLQCDRFALLAPNWYIEREGAKMKVIIEMPIISPLRETIEGPAMSTKTAAKRAAALEVCKKLHQIGELTDRLLPRTQEEDELDFEYLFSHWIKETVDGDDSKKKKSKPGTKKYIRQYEVPVPQFLKGPKSQTYYLHPILMKTDHSWDKLHQKILVHTTLDYALLTSQPLPNLCSFPIFVSAGKIEISILNNDSLLDLSDNDLADLKKFNHFVFNEVLQILKDFLMYNESEESEFMIVVPVKNNIPDNYLELDPEVYIPKNYDFHLDLEAARRHIHLVPVTEPSKQNKIDLEISIESYVGKIVEPWYRQSSPYIVLEVSPVLNALSPWPNEKFSSYEEYYRDRYSIVLENPSLPLLYVKGISQRLNCILPRSISLHAGSKRNKLALTDSMEEHLIPETCCLQDFPGTLWYKAHCLPTIIHRVFCLLRAEELRQRITKETKIGTIDQSECENWSTMPVDQRVLKIEEKKIKPQQINIPETDAPAIKPETQAFSKRLTNADYSNKMLEKQYKWKTEEEPIDIDRNIDAVTLLDIQLYDSFMSEKYSYKDVEKTTGSSLESRYPLLKIRKGYENRPIKMLLKTRTSFGPQQWEIFQSLTSNKANDILNLERTETLGDSFLKLSTTLFLFLKYPQCSEGRLTNIKGKIIGNRNLLYCGLKKNLGGYMKVTELSLSDWMPPSYRVPTLLKERINNKELLPCKLFEFAVPMEEQLSGKLSELTVEEFTEIITDINKEEYPSNEPVTTSMNKFLGGQDVQDKTVSDCVESLIGIYLQKNGLTGGLSMLEWFNIIPSEQNPCELFHQNPPDPLIHPFIQSKDVDFLLKNYSDLEKRLGYVFNNRAYLLQALTHASYSTNRITDCYQRLEFLGDAVLDFLITSHIFEMSDTLTPGQLTDLRSALVNNVTFAVLVARYGFYKHLKYNNTKLMEAIEVFVKFQEERDFVIDEEALILVEDHPMYISEHVDVPKVLGDLFESLAGAVFLDSGMDLAVTWRVFHFLMWQEIDAFSINIPRNPVRMLYENTSAAPHFQDAQVINHKVTLVTCSVMIDGKKHEVHGFGENKVQAKRAASKFALKLLSRD